MQKKISKYLFLFSILILILSVILFTLALYKNAVNNEITEQKTKLNFLKKAYNLNGMQYFKNLESNNNRITIINKTGKVIFDNEVDKDSMENHIEREEIKEAIKFGFSSSYRFSNTKYEYRLYSAIRLDSGDILRISKPSIILIETVINFLKSLFLIIIIIVILTGIFSKKISKKLVNPINDINLDNPLKNEIYEELSPFLVKIDKQNKKIDSQIKNLDVKNYEIKYITEHISDGIIIISDSKKVLRINNIASKLTNIKENEYYLIGCRIIEFKNAVENALKGINTTKKIKIKDSIYMMISSAVKLENSKYGVFISLRNIDEEENREVLRREFTANVSHELKTPLTSIMGTAELFANNFIIGSEDVSKFGSKIYNESSRLLCIIEDLIKLSMLDENVSFKNLEELSFDEIIEKVILDFESELNKKSIELSKNISEIKIKGIKSLIYDMVYNLINNAIKYSNEFGKIEILLRLNNDKIVLTIKDNGIGIDTSEFKNIFERFYRVDKSHSKSTGGTGLGLSIVKHIALLHKGSVDVKSDGIGRGAEFIVTLPNN